MNIKHRFDVKPLTLKGFIEFMLLGALSAGMTIDKVSPWVTIVFFIYCLVSSVSVTLIHDDSVRKVW